MFISAIIIKFPTQFLLPTQISYPNVYPDALINCFFKMKTRIKSAFCVIRTTDDNGVEKLVLIVNT